MHPHRLLTQALPVPQSVVGVHRQLLVSKSHVLFAEQSLSSPHEPEGTHSPTDGSHASAPHISAGALSQRGTQFIPDPPTSAHR